MSIRNFKIEELGAAFEGKTREWYLLLIEGCEEAVSALAAEIELARCSDGVWAENVLERNPVEMERNRRRIAEYRTKLAGMAS